MHDLRGAGSLDRGYLIHQEVSHLWVQSRRNGDGQMERMVACGRPEKHKVDARVSTAIEKLYKFVVIF